MPLKGESQKSCATLLTSTEIAPQEVTYLEDPKSNDCCYDLIAFVNPPLITDPVKNDKYHYLFRFDKDLVASTLMKLQRYEGGWNDISNLSNNTYGTFEAYGYFVSDITNEKYTAYLVDWIKVYNLHGLGHYRVICEATDIFGNPPTAFYGFSFCLKIYSAEQADGTVRLEWIHNGVVGNAEVDEKQIDYSDLSFYQQFRIGAGSKFRWTGATEEKESNWLQNGEMLDISRKQNPTLSLLIGHAPIEIHEIILFDCFMADTIQITDYNNVNFIRGGKSFFKKQVKKNGAYNIADIGQSQLVSVDVELEAAINNHNKQLC